MCGIYGQYNFTSDKPIVQQELREATRTLTHRGPTTRAITSNVVSGWDSGVFQSSTFPAVTSR